MNLEHLAAKLFNMTDEAWERHANPWSVWTRYSCLPLLILAIWSYAWVGWLNTIAIAVICLWMWLNPRIFKKPTSTNNWASKAVLGERILLSAPKNSIPKHHQNMLLVLKLVMSAATLLVIVGLVAAQAAWVYAGTLAVILAKSWFLDRMVWLYEDMSRTHPEYKKWLY